MKKKLTFHKSFYSDSQRWNELVLMLIVNTFRHSNNQYNAEIAQAKLYGKNVVGHEVRNEIAAFN